MFREIDKNDLDKIRNWRNAPDVRKNMFTDHIISAEEHLAWWKSLSKDISRQCLLFVHNGIDVGVVNFFDIEVDIDDKTKTCHWGFYLANDLKDFQANIQAWQSLEIEAIDYAFTELGCQQLYCETFRFNKPVLEMHKRFGFVEIAIEQHKKGSLTEEVVVTVLKSKNILIPEKSPYIRFNSRCLLMGSSNLDFIKTSFIRSAEHYSIELQIVDIPYGQYQIAVNDPGSSIYVNDTKDHSSINNTIIFLERIEDFLPFNEILCSHVLDELTVQWAEYLNFIRHCRSILSGSFIIANAASVSRWLTDSAPYSDENKKISLALNKMQQDLERLCKELSDVYIFDLADLIQDVGREAAHPEKYWYLARAPFSAVFNERLSEKIIALMMSIEAKNARVIVLDLDNTLWSGVIGDDGMEGIAVDGDYPGNVFQNIQATMLNYQKRGLLLAVCSKNTEKTVLEVFNKHSGMLLSLDDLTAWRINWKPKADNLIELSKELGLSLSSFCFIDDNPLEREEIRSCLPEVFVPELPDEISEWPETIKRLPELAAISIGEDDRNRAQQYKIRADINKKKLKAESRSDFLIKLEMKLSFEHYNEINQQRILQLINKTNQFNATTRRYKKIELEQFIQTGQCYAVRLNDRLGSNEIIGVLMFTIETSVEIKIDTFLLSCRVLGRDIETAILAWLSIVAQERDIQKLMGEIIPTKRNQPVQSLYKKLDFKQVDERFFEIDVTKKIIQLPNWITLE